MSLGLLFFRTETEVYWNLLMAASVLVILGPLIIFFFVQRIVITGIKG